MKQINNNNKYCKIQNLKKWTPLFDSYGVYTNLNVATLYK